MSFLYPAFLIGAAAVAIPLLLHLLRNEQAPELPFSAVRLLRGVKVEHAQRRRIRNWLLLVLRAAALLLLAAAFARPYLSGHQVAGGAASIIVLDRSASMAIGTAWERAKQAVVREIDDLPRGEAVALVAFDDRAEVVVPPTSDRGEVKARLGSLQRGIGGTRYQPALARAVSLLDEADARNGRIVLVSDLQGTPADARATIPAAIKLDVRNVAAPVSNIAVLAAHRTSDGVVAALRHDGSSPAHVRVRLDAGDGGRIAEAPVDLPPYQLVELPLRAAVNGNLRIALAEPDAGGFTADDARYLEAGAEQRSRVLLVSDPDDRFYLDAALRAAGDTPEFDVTSASVQGMMGALAQQPAPPVVFLAGPRGLDRAGRDALVRYVASGGSLFVAASDAVNEPGFAPVLDGMTVSAPRGDDPVLTLAAVESRHPLFRRLGPVAGSMSAARFTRAWRVRAPGWRVLARFDDGAPALLERSLGTGRVLFFASDVNRTWNDLPVHSAFVPFVQEVARYLAPARTLREFTPGTLPEGVPPALGFLTLASGQRVVVNADPRESDSARMDAAQFASAVRHRGERRLDAGAARRRAQAVEARQSLWRYGLMLMFGTLVVEGLVGGRKRS